MSALTIRILIQRLAEDMFLACFSSDIRRGAPGTTAAEAVLGLIERHGQDLIEIERIDHRGPASDQPAVLRKGPEFETVDAGGVEPLPWPTPAEIIERITPPQPKKLTNLDWNEANDALHAGLKVASDSWKDGSYIEKDENMLPHWAIYPFGKGPARAWPAGNVQTANVTKLQRGKWHIVND